MNDMTHTRKVLLIDDDPGEHTVLKTILTVMPPPVKPPIVVLGSLTFEGGLVQVIQERPDVVLLDLKLSETMLGPQTIASMHAHLADIVPVVLITGHMEATDDWTLPQLWREARHAGACGFLRKDRYLDPRYRSFLLHSLHDATIEFAVRKEQGIVFNPQNPLLKHGSKTKQ